MIEFLAALLVSASAAPSLQLVNPEFLFPQKGPGAETGDSSAMGGQDGEVAILTANGWEYSRIPGTPWNKVTQILWYHGKLVALTTHALYLRDPISKSWNLIFTNSDKTRASIAKSGDSICYLNGSVGFACSQDAYTWNVIDSYALDAVLFRGKTKWMAFAGTVFYDHDSSRWNYYKDYSLSRFWEINKTGLLTLASGNLVYYSTSHQPDWTVPVNASSLLTKPDGLITAYGNDTTYHILDGKIILRKIQNPPLGISRSNFYNWRGKILAHIYRSSEFQDFILYESEDGVDWKKIPGIRSHILSMIHHKGVFIGGGDSGAIVLSEDGVHWREVVLPRRKTVRSILSFKDGLWALADSTTLFQSTDGSIWNELQPNLRRKHFKLLSFQDTLYAVDRNGVWKSGDGAHWESSAPDSTGRGADFVTDGKTIVYGNSQSLRFKTTNSDWISAPTPYTTIAGCGDGIWISRGDTIHKVASNMALERYAEIPASTGIIKMFCGNGKLLALTADSLLLFEKGQRILGIFPNHSLARITGAVFQENELFLHGMEGRIFRIDLDPSSSVSRQNNRPLRWRPLSGGIQIDSPDARIPLVFDHLGRPVQISCVNRSSKGTSIRIKPPSSGILFVKLGTDVSRILAP